VLTLAALTNPITAGDKRSSALAVRVTVVRSCSVNTDTGAPSGGTVTCGSRFGPPVMSASSVVTLPAAAPPPARVESAAAVQKQVSGDGDPQAPRSGDAPAGRIDGTSDLPDDSAGSGTHSRGTEATELPRAIRVVTVNF
jgi:hypothetical protein